MADWTSISLLTRGSATAIASNFRLDRLLAGVLVDLLGMDTTIGILNSPSAYHLSRPMHHFVYVEEIRPVL
jgi:hypothetical protein